jgi:hypothetical protein
MHDEAGDRDESKYRHLELIAAHDLSLKKWMAELCLRAGRFAACGPSEKLRTTQAYFRDKRDKKISARRPTSLLRGYGGLLTYQSGVSVLVESPDADAAPVS